MINQAKLYIARNLPPRAMLPESKMSGGDPPNEAVIKWLSRELVVYRNPYYICADTRSTSFAVSGETKPFDFFGFFG